MGSSPRPPAGRSSTSTRSGIKGSSRSSRAARCGCSTARQDRCARSPRRPSTRNPRPSSPLAGVLTRRPLARVSGDAAERRRECLAAVDRRRDGTGAHEVARLAVDSLVGWSPTADQLAVIADAKGWDFSGLQDQRPVQVELVSARRTVRLLLALSTSATRPGRVDSAAWSPNGDELAVSVANPRLSVSANVSAFPVAGGKPTTWFSIAANKGLPGICSGCGNEEVIAHLAGWWPRWGIAFWSYCCGATRNLDNTPLELLTGPGAQPRLIAQTLSDGVTDAVAAGPGGSLAVVATTTEGRDIGQGKVVETCDTHTHACTPLSGGSIWTGPGRGQCAYFSGAPCSAVRLAVWHARLRRLARPCLVPDGSQLLAYVLAPYHPQRSRLDARLVRGARAVPVGPTRTGSTREARPCISGASVPTWSRDGRHLLYVNGRRPLARTGWARRHAGRDRAPAVPRTASGRRPALAISYNGQIDWTGQFSWSSP
jgi:hypothetical protein